MRVNEPYRASCLGLTHEKTNGEKLRNMSDEERTQFFQTLEYLYSIHPTPVTEL